MAHGCTWQCSLPQEVVWSQASGECHLGGLGGGGLGEAGGLGGGELGGAGGLGGGGLGGGGEFGGGLYAAHQLSELTRLDEESSTSQGSTSSCQSAMKYDSQQAGVRHLGGLGGGGLARDGGGGGTELG